MFIFTLWYINLYETSLIKTKNNNCSLTSFYLDVRHEKLFSVNLDKAVLHNLEWKCSICFYKHSLPRVRKLITGVPKLSTKCWTGVHHPRVGIHFPRRRPSECTWYTGCIMAAAHDCKCKKKKENKNVVRWEESNSTKLISEYTNRQVFIPKVCRFFRAGVAIIQSMHFC